MSLGFVLARSRTLLLVHRIGVRVKVWVCEPVEEAESVCIASVILG